MRMRACNRSLRRRWEGMADVKFLVDRRGVPVKRFKPAFDPLDFEADVRASLIIPIQPPYCYKALSFPIPNHIIIPI